MAGRMSPEEKLGLAALGAAAVFTVADLAVRFRRPIETVATRIHPHLGEVTTRTLDRAEAAVTGTRRVVAQAAKILEQVAPTPPTRRPA